MKKILLTLAYSLCFSLILTAQEKDIEPVSDTNINNDSGFKTILDRLLRSDKMLNIKFDTRVDYSAKFNDNETEESGFRGQTVKIWFVGEIAPGIRYRIRQRLNKTQTPLRDNYGPSTDQAFIELDAGEKWTFRVGKQSVQFGTFEYDYNPADIYLPTMCFDDLDAYKTGVNIAYKVANQTLNFQVVNSDAPQFATQKYKNKSLAGLFLWEGSLFNEAVKTRYGYGAFQHNASKYYSWITLGTQINIQKFTTELDWYMGDRDMDFGSIVQDETLGDRHVRDNSVAVNLKYDLGKIKPSIKGVWNERKDQLTDGSYSGPGAQALVEYYPFTDPALKDLRFHVMYAYNKTNYNGIYNQLEGINQHQIIAGMRWMFKIK